MIAAQDESLSSKSLDSEGSSDESEKEVEVIKSKPTAIINPSCVINNIIAYNKVVRYWLVEDKYSIKNKDKDNKWLNTD